MTDRTAEPCERATSKDRLRALLEVLAEHDRAIEARTYERFLVDPVVRDLFGSSHASRRQMFDDTLIAIHDLCDDASWLEENLLALGSRHRHTYEVRVSMYDAWRDAIVDGTRDVVGDRLDAPTEGALREALDRIHGRMLVGAYPKGIPRTPS